LFALYNNDPNDDPGDPGTAPGSLFFVDRLKPLASSPGGLVGEVFLPTRIIEVEVAGGSTVVVEELWVCEDTVTRGTSPLDAARVVRELGAEPVMILAVVDRGGTCRAAAEAQGMAFVPLVTASDLGFDYEGP
jgi:hypothetical protein